MSAAAAAAAALAARAAVPSPWPALRRLRSPIACGCAAAPHGCSAQRLLPAEMWRRQLGSAECWARPAAWCSRRRSPARRLAQEAVLQQVRRWRLGLGQGQTAAAAAAAATAVAASPPAVATAVAAAPAAAAAGALPMKATCLCWELPAWQTWPAGRGAVNRCKCLLRGSGGRLHSWEFAGVAGVACCGLRPARIPSFLVRDVPPFPP